MTDRNNKIVIAFLARAGSGKSTAAQYLSDRHGAEKVSFAAPLKELAKHLWGFTDSQVYGDNKESADEVLAELWDVDNATPRMALQLLGNQAREIIGKNVWIDAAMNSIEKAESNLVVIDDCRYLNEVMAISELPHGHVIKIVSPDRQSNADPNHPSEAEVDRAPESLLSAIVSNPQSEGLEAFHRTLSACLPSIMNTFPGKLRG